LMPYYSFPVQQIRCGRGGIRLIDGLAKDGYIGIYTRCGGLDSHRFVGKGQSEDKWADLFAYYFELWVTDKALAALQVLVGAGDVSLEVDRSIGGELAQLLDVDVAPFPSTAEARQYLAGLRRQLDLSVNNASFTNEMAIQIIVSRGRLFFGLPAIVCRAVPFLKDILFVYLLDEFENFTIPQQVFINTLIREKEGPTSFKVGARLYGIKTQRTFSGGERNLQGSEYEKLLLDERFRTNSEAYRQFALKLIPRRLSVALLRGSLYDDDRTRRISYGYGECSSGRSRAEQSAGPRLC